VFERAHTDLPFPLMMPANTKFDDFGVSLTWGELATKESMPSEIEMKLAALAAQPPSTAASAFETEAQQQQQQQQQLQQQCQSESESQRQSQSQIETQSPSPSPPESQPQPQPQPESILESDPVQLQKHSSPPGSSPVAPFYWGSSEESQGPRKDPWFGNDYGGFPHMPGHPQRHTRNYLVSVGKIREVLLQDYENLFEAYSPDIYDDEIRLEIGGPFLGEGVHLVKGKKSYMTRLDTLVMISNRVMENATVKCSIHTAPEMSGFDLKAYWSIDASVSFLSRPFHITAYSYYALSEEVDPDGIVPFKIKRHKIEVQAMDPPRLFDWPLKVFVVGIWPQTLKPSYAMTLKPLLTSDS